MTPEPLRVGLLLSDLGDTELARRLLEGGHAYYGAGGGDDILAFVQHAAPPPLTPPFASMNLAEAFGFAGAAVATTRATAAALLHFPGPSRRYFYAWDREWTRGDWPYAANRAVYAAPTLQLLARTEADRRVIESCWNRPVRAVVPDADLPRLLALIREDTTRVPSHGEEASDQGRGRDRRGRAGGRPGR